MKKFAVASSAYNSMLESNRGASILALLPHSKTKPLGCTVSVYLAESAEQAEELAMKHCHDLFPEALGWEQHTVAVCDIDATLLMEPT
jgi:hypothetical protein